MKLVDVLPQFYEGATIYRSSLINQDRTYYQYNNALIPNKRKVSCWYISRMGKIMDIPFSMSHADFIAEDWTIQTLKEENKQCEAHLPIQSLNMKEELDHVAQRQAQTINH